MIWKMNICILPPFMYIHLSWFGHFWTWHACIQKINKAIRDGKYLALPHSSAWQRSPHFCCDVISLLARVFIFLIDTATQEVPIKKYLKEIVCHYAIELLGSLPSDEAWRHLRYITFVYRVHWPTGSMYTKVCNDSLNITIATGSQRS